MRFVDFLRTTVLMSAAAASALAAVTLAGVAGGDGGDGRVIEISAGWWVISGLIGLWLGRRGQATQPIATLLADARTQATLPEVNPARVVLNRLWPLLLCTIGAAALGLLAPQIPGIATGFCVIWALAWRRQSSAVTAIEERDGARFYVQPTSPLRRIQLVRTPGFRSNLRELNGATASRRAQPRA